ncbi:MAG: hypothetical protein ABIV28_03105 [Longimicrobiales bacterium]
MAIHHRVAAVALSALVLTGCPYHGSVPLGEPAGPLDPRLLGDWRLSSEPASEHPFASGRLLISRFDDDEYAVVGSGACPAAGGRGYLTTVDGRTFLNVHEQGEEGKYRVTKVDFVKGGVLLRDLDSDFDTVSTTTALRALVQSRIDDPTIFDDSITRARVGEVREEGPNALRWIDRACPYQPAFDFGTRTPDRAAVRDLVGSWMLRVRNDSAMVTVGTDSAGGLTASLGWFGEDGDDKPEPLSAMRINGVLFVTILTNDDDRTIARVDVKGDTLVITPLSVALKATNAFELRSILDRPTVDPAIYFWESYRLVRVKRP